MVIMVGPHEDMSVTLWSTEQCLTFLVQRNSVASTFGSVCVRVCVYCMYGLGEVKGTKSFVTCGFTCLVLKLMTNLWGVCPCVCSYLLACARVMSLHESVFFSHFTKPAMPLQTFTVCWHCRQWVCVCLYTYACVYFLYCFCWTFAADHRENTGMQAPSSTPAIHHNDARRLGVPMHKNNGRVCACVCVCVFCFFQSERRRNPTLQACLSLRRKLDRRRV